jgi:cytochrome P450
VPSVTPAPPRAPSGLPWLGQIVPFLRDPNTFLSDARTRLGDTFLVDLAGFRLFCVFGPIGLRSLYALPEDEASFGEATRTLLGLKLPPALQAGDLAMFQHLFSRERMESYLGHIGAAVDDALVELGDAGEVELFAHMKRLVHRIGFRCWAGREAATPPHFEALVHAFERLDPEEAFVHPSRLLWTVVTRKAPERRALAAAAMRLAIIWADRARRGVREDDMLDQLHRLFPGEPERVAKNVMILHLASLSNLYAALAWTFVNLLLHPTHRDAVRAEADAVAARYGATYLRDQRALADLLVSRRLRDGVDPHGAAVADAPEGDAAVPDGDRSGELRARARHLRRDAARGEQHGP